MEELSQIPEEFDILYDRVKKKTFGHLTGGINREGKDFLTIYHGVETITKAKKP